MKLLINACVLTVLGVSTVGQAKAQIDVGRAIIHAAPTNPEGIGPVVTGGPSAQDPQSARIGAVIADAAATDPPLLSPQERGFFDALGRRLTNGAAAYESYVRSAAAIDPRFTDARSVQSALLVAENYNPAQLQEGAIAYAAVLALRNQAFVDGVRAQNERGLAEALIADPEAVLHLPGAYAAARDVSGVMLAQAGAVRGVGRQISDAAYSVQRQAWSQRPVAEPQKILALAKTSAIKLATADLPSQRRLLDNIAVASSGSGANSAPSDTVTQGLALAAVAILGGTGDERESRFEPLLRDLRNADCLRMAKLNLNQCLAVAGPQYDDVFCLGQHAVGETGQCLLAAADTEQAPEGMRTAQLEGYGSERAEAYGQAAPR